ncbi:hypothetical protein WJT86_11160 [Microvirga sp. W0021]|uniref:Universal stress protein n=1 Tax=Hohaiivirga grylli TaxID=3133970 RepID=A0ABV0BN43_9HYPH
MNDCDGWAEDSTRPSQDIFQTSKDTPRRIIVALTSGAYGKAAILDAVIMAKEISAELVGIATIDAKRLDNVGFIPAGGNYYAAKLRSQLLERAKLALEETVQFFKETAAQAQVNYSLCRQNGEPTDILQNFQRKEDMILVGRFGWFDHGVSQQKIDPMPLLAKKNIFPIFCSPQQG